MYQVPSMEFVYLGNSAFHRENGFGSTLYLAHRS